MKQIKTTVHLKNCLVLLKSQFLWYSSNYNYLENENALNNNPRNIPKLKFQDWTNCHKKKGACSVSRQSVTLTIFISAN